ncbi:hypothetical protein WDJ50_11385 [Deinococcus sp. VB142]|uniref:HD-CE domain-containing protein n=1 Tax=Deinococcus sp. VB142 TaxID=3112952 RepID=A0AAU6Q028_9DEIO
MEKWLKKRADASTGDALVFPGNENYYNIYRLQKDRLETHVFPFVNAGLVAFGEGGYQIYSDHGLLHVNAVIKIAGQLLGCTNEDSDIRLSPYEVFLFLMSALAHDAGNLEGRERHEIRAFKVLNAPETKVMNNPFEMRSIHDIAVSHTAKKLLGGGKDKDTISKLKGQISFSSIPFRPQSIAALLRISDEICEDQSRIPRVLLGNASIRTGPSAPFLFFGNSITSVDIINNEVIINIEISEDLVENPLKFNKVVLDDNGDVKFNSTGLETKEAEIFLSEEILDRLTKIHLEWVYCIRYLRDIIIVNQIRSEISISIEQKDDYVAYIVNVASINLGEYGYPSGASRIDNGSLSPESLKMKLETGRVEKGVQ